MTSAVRVAASLWSTHASLVDQEARRLALGGVQRFHWDASDGQLGPAGGFAPSDARRIHAHTGTTGEAHLMTLEPERDLDAWLECCDTIVVHRTAPGWLEAVERIEAAGRRAAVAVEHDRDLEGLDRSLGVLVMSVRPGHAGSGFDLAALDRVRAAANAGHRSIGVDGSVTPELGWALVDAGADWLVSGGSLTGAASPAEWLDRLAR
ncbi:hypothetical protein AA0Z99_10815 [Agrococcus sp. 1P02AA]|uniref:hypothetical protein n=1 Tax=Agrococcus sp. 1P02AA TaxID=3132259 RepID=UPI0039A4E47B